MGWCQHCTAPHVPPPLTSRRYFCAIDVWGCNGIDGGAVSDKLPLEAVWHHIWKLYEFLLLESTWGGMLLGF